MQEAMRELKKVNCDAYFFLPSGKKSSLSLEGMDYVDAGEKIEGSNFGLGDSYHIMLFQENANGLVHNEDLFEGVLGSPLEYVEIMIKLGWYGLVCRKTTTSNKFVDNVFDKIREQ